MQGGGLFTVVLGKTFPLDPAMFLLVDPELEVKIDGEAVPKVELSSVACTFRAGDSDALGGFGASAYQRRAPFVIGFNVFTQGGRCCPSLAGR